MKMPEWFLRTRPEELQWRVEHTTSEHREMAREILKFQEKSSLFTLVIILIMSTGLCALLSSLVPSIIIMFATYLSSLHARYKAYEEQKTREKSGIIADFKDLKKKQERRYGVALIRTAIILVGASSYRSQGQHSKNNILIGIYLPLFSTIIYQTADYQHFIQTRSIQLLLEWLSESPNMPAKKKIRSTKEAAKTAPA